MNVTMPDGRVIINVPEGTTKSEILRRYSKLGPSMSAVPDDAKIPTGLNEVSRETSRVESSNPGNSFLDRSIIENPEKLVPPVLGMAGTALAGPAGLALSSLAGGIGAGAGELIKQSYEGDIKPLEAAKSGAWYALGNYAGGKAFEGISWLLKKAFTAPVNQSAVQFAQENDIPYLGDKRVLGGKLTLAGDAYTKSQIAKASEAINAEMATATNGIQNLDQADDAVNSAVTAGRQFFDDMLGAGKEGIGGPLNNLKAEIGEDAVIQTTNTAPAIDDALTYLKDKLGIDSGQVYQRLSKLQKNAGEARTLKDMDEIYGDLWRLWNTRANRSTRQAVETVGNAIVKDLDEAAVAAGYQGFGQEFAQALSQREAFRELMKKYPEFRTLEKVPENMTRQWLNTLFGSSPKALEELKSANPQVYDDLSNAWLARSIYSSTKPSPSGQVLDGKKFLQWVNSNKTMLDSVFGEKSETLYKFAQYANTADKAIANTKGMSPVDFMARAGTEAALMVKAPMIAIPAEGTSLALAYGLTNPNSWLFKMFTAGPSEASKKALGMSLRIGGGTLLQESTNPNEQ